MENLVFIACALAVVKAGYTNNQIYSPNGINGYPQGGSFAQSDPKGSAIVYTSSSSFVPQPYVPSGSGSFSSEISHGSNGYASAGPKGGEYVPVIKDGVPVDTPEVQRARAEHFALYAKAAAEAAKVSAADGKYGGQQNYQPKYTQIYYTKPNAGYITDYNYQSGEYPSSSGVSQDYNQIAAPYTQHYRHRRGIEYSQFTHDLYNVQPQHVPVITKEGVPVETPEVQVAKAQHFLAHAKANAEHNEWNQGTESYRSGHTGWVNYGTPQVNNIQYSVKHENTYGGWQPYHGPQHIPLLDKHGVPVETSEVQAAKQQHFLAHSQAKSNSYGLHQGLQYSGSLVGSSVSHQGIPITSDGVPEETPEVKIAKARHLIAHAQERAKHAQWTGYGSSYSHY